MAGKSLVDGRRSAAGPFPAGALAFIRPWNWPQLLDKNPQNSHSRITRGYTSPEAH